MKKVLLTIVAAICCLGVSGQEKVTKANYALAERFSAKKVNQMVFSTRVMPNWFRDGDRFWYEWKTPQGTSYYLVDPAKGTRSEIFDMEKLAMQVTEQVRYPFDAAHIPMRNLKLKEDRYFHFDIVSGLNKDKDTTYFRYDIVTRKLDTVGKEKKKYPMWASVSPDGKVGVFAKGSNLWIMDSTNLRKAAVNEKDTTLVEYKLTTDGDAEFTAETVHDDVQVKFAHTTDDGLAGLVVGPYGERRVFLSEFAESDAEFVQI